MTFRGLPLVVQAALSDGLAFNPYLSAAGLSGRVQSRGLYLDDAHAEASSSLNTTATLRKAMGRVAAILKQSRSQLFRSTFTSQVNSFDQRIPPTLKKATIAEHLNASLGMDHHGNCPRIKIGEKCLDCRIGR